MTEDSKEKKPLRLSGSGKLEMKKPGTSSGQVRQSFSHGRSKTVTVEVKKKRTQGTINKSIPKSNFSEDKKEKKPIKVENNFKKPFKDKDSESTSKARVVLKALTDDEKIARARALEDSKKASDLARKKAEEVASIKIKEEEAVEAERAAAAEREELEHQRKQKEDEARKKAEEAAARRLGEKETADTSDDSDQDENRKRRPGRGDLKKVVSKNRGTGRRRSGKVTISEALDDTERTRSLASVRRQREREKRQAQEQTTPEVRSKVYRDVLIPDTISVQELANRMSERGADVIKSLMKMGVMVTINQSVDADTAELIVGEFGHRPKRFSESDVEIGFLTGKDDKDSEKVERPPIVTVMGHVDHGKTSLLDALRESEITSSEAGGITQHIGAYQVTLPKNQIVTFLDTPGHEAFTSMRARGAKVTDIVVLVVAADDGVMPQTIEAIQHAKAAETPIIVAVNKIDKQGANPDKIKQDLLKHEVFVEDMGGDILSVEISALKKQGLDKLLEAILLQAELMDLKANDSLSAEGIVIESKVERGRGSVATILVQRGRLEIGDVIVAGKEWGKVRALLDDKGSNISEVVPGQPAEVLGLTGTPEAGDDFGVIENESRAREISSFRLSEVRKNEAARAASSKGSLEQMFQKKEGHDAGELCVLIKTDVHGSLEAIDGAINNLTTSEVSVRTIHGAVGGINESDIALALASNALVVGFNVRANAQARDKAKIEGVDVRYFSIIYDLVNDIKSIMSGMLEPTIKENMLGQARVKEVFSVSKIGKVAGCEVTDGLAKRNAKVRLLRDDVVIYESTIETLKHFKDDAKEVKSGSDCGIGLANYQDVQKGDILEIFETEEIARSL